MVVNDCFVYEEWIRGQKHQRGMDWSRATVVVLARDNSILDQCGQCDDVERIADIGRK